MGAHHLETHILIGAAHVHLGRVGAVLHAREFVELGHIVPVLSVVACSHQYILPAVGLPGIAIEALVVLEREGLLGFAQLHLQVMRIVGGQRTCAAAAHIGVGVAVNQASQHG